MIDVIGSQASGPKVRTENVVLWQAWRDFPRRIIVAIRVIRSGRPGGDNEFCECEDIEKSVGSGRNKSQM